MRLAALAATMLYCFAVSPARAVDWESLVNPGPVVEGHAKTEAQCRKCHQPARKYSQAPSDCLSCHRADDTHKGKLGPACADCHTEQNW